MSALDQIKKIHFNIYKKQGKCCKKDLAQNLQNCNTEVVDQLDSVISELEDNPKLFWVAHHGPDDWEIRCKVNIRLCGDYLSGKCTGCSSLHICKNFLISGKFCVGRECKFGFSHDIHDNHNTMVWRKTEGDCNIRLPNLTLIRSSFPRLCESFKNNGTCNKQFCGYLHVCLDYIHDQCTGKCEAWNNGVQKRNFYHNWSTEHNRKVLRIFDLSHLKQDRSELISNLLVLKNEDRPVDLPEKPSRQRQQQQQQNDRKGHQKPEKQQQKPEQRNQEQQGNKQQQQQQQKQQQQRQQQQPQQQQQQQQQKQQGQHEQQQKHQLKQPPALLPPSKSTVKRKPPLLLCTFYLQGSCTNYPCPRLHMCKEFLVNSDGCGKKICKFGFSHNPFDDINYAVLQRHLADVTSHSAVMEKIRQSFPRVCREYKMGKSCANCKKIHACPLYLHNQCNQDTCALSHDLKDSHNMTVLLFYSLDTLTELYVMTNILYSKLHKPVSNIPAAEPAVSLNSSMTLPDAAIVPNLIDVDVINVDDVFMCVVKSSESCSCSLYDEQLQQFFRCYNVTPEKWFAQHPDRFRLTKTKSGEIIVHALAGSIKICTFYWKKIGCTNDECTSVHICKKYLVGIDHSVECLSNHNLRYERAKCPPYQQHLSDNELLMLLRFRLPYVCLAYSNTICEEGEEFCPHLHVCYQFVLGKCKRLNCRYAHEKAYQGDQAMRLMEEFCIDTKDFLFLVLLPNKKADISRLLARNSSCNSGIPQRGA